MLKLSILSCQTTRIALRMSRMVIHIFLVVLTAGRRSLQPVFSKRQSAVLTVKTAEFIADSLYAIPWALRTS
jgi:hypothetical protein